MQSLQSGSQKQLLPAPSASSQRPTVALDSVRISPAAGLISPAEDRVSPADDRVSPVEQLVSPAEQRVSPVEKRVSPAEQRVSPADRDVAPPPAFRAASREESSRLVIDSRPAAPREEVDPPVEGCRLKGHATLRK
eukprot:2121305-Rhodomonas_salina.1